MKKGTKTEEIFEMIMRGIDASYKIFDNPRGMMRYGYDDLLRIEEAQKRRERKMAVERLKTQDYIKIKKIGDKIFLELTEKGKFEAFKRLIFTKQSKLPKGHWCIVSFDIPESVRYVRRELRIMLKSLGFTMVHQSVWISDRDVGVELVKFVRKLKAGKWITVFVGSKIK